MIDAVIFDADDTLWKTEPLYDKALDAAQEEVEHRGVDGDQWRALQRQIDRENVKTMGFSVERFPLSSRSAYEALTPDNTWHQAGADKVADLSRGVFRSVAELFPEVEVTLQALRHRGYKLGLITKGDFNVQNQRIADSGLGKYFTAYVVVTDKTPELFAGMATLLGAQPRRTVSIGNSVSSDLEPAAEVGIRGIWIEAYVWEHEQHDGRELPDGVIQLRTFSQIPDALEKF